MCVEASHKSTLRKGEQGYLGTCALAGYLVYELWIGPSAGETDRPPLLCSRQMGVSPPYTRQQRRAGAARASGETRSDGSLSGRSYQANLVILR